jgi:bifunctional non-homologous end joining protein LigD
VVFLAADLLHLDSTPVAAWPLDRRQEALAILVPPHPRLQVPGWVEGHGRAFCDAAADHGLSAVLARRGGAPYRAGMASPDRLRIALADTADAVVAGVVWAADAPPRRGGRRRPAPTALLLAEWHDGHLVDAGRAGARLDGAAEAWLAVQLDELASRVPLCSVDLDRGDPVTWLRPGLVATVVHHGRDEAGRLRLPGLVGVRDDRDPAWCIRRPAVAPPEDTPLATGPGFRPTVLHTLPLGDG